MNDDTTNHPMKRCASKEDCWHPQSDNGWLPATLCFFGQRKSSKDWFRSNCKACEQIPAKDRYPKPPRDGMKRCTSKSDCLHLEQISGGWLPMTDQYWSLHSGISSGLNPKCKACESARGKEHYRSNRDRIIRRQVEHHRQNRERYNRYQSAYYKANREKVRSSAHQWYWSHRDQERKRLRKYYETEHGRAVRLTYRERNKDRVRQREREYTRKHPEAHSRAARRWRTNHPEKAKALEHRRRSRRKGAPGEFSPTDIRLQYQSQGGLCWWCSKPLNNIYHVDHVIPLSRGGTNDPRNLVCACEKCNLSKGAKTPAEWKGRLF